MRDINVKQQKNTPFKPYKKAHKPAAIATWNTKMREAFMAAIAPLDQKERK
jgi:hypothetical protein